MANIHISKWEGLARKFYEQDVEVVYIIIAHILLANHSHTALISCEVLCEM